MEALAAISLAGNVCQFVEIASKVLKEGKQISIAGTSLSVQHMSLVTGDLEKLLASLKQHIAACRTTDDAMGGSGPLRSEDQALLEIARGCEEVVTTMLKGLERYPQAVRDEEIKEDEESKNTNKSSDGKGSRVKRNNVSLRNIRAALTMVWGSKHITELQDRLNSYRAEISLRLLVFLNAGHRDQSRTLNRLEMNSHEVTNQIITGHQEIVEVISMQCNTLKLELDEGRQEYTELARTSREEAEKRHAETIAAIVTHRDGHQSTIASPQGSQGSQTTLRKAVTTDQNFASRTFYSEGGGGDTEACGSYTDNPSINLRDFTNRILDSLAFREMDERKAGVAAAYDHTFEWIYDSTTDCGNRWDPFAKWLRSGTGIYWINGKAGSGKSTLMKYLSGHESTRAILNQWRGDDDLVVGTFFFWYAGTALQKSQTGLLRSLLSRVLRGKSELVPVLFPNVIRALQSGQQDGPLELTITELKLAFENLVGTNVLATKMCFIIDGLDEYDGDQEELACLFAKVTRSDKVKIIVSSRPIPACVHAFSGCPNLRLQDLTYNDIWCFAEDQLTQHPLMQDLESENLGATTELVDAILSKASGVFLWVAVVVKLLIRGLRDYDNVKDLHRKINDLPEELEKLYSHMLRAMSKADRTQGSKFLQIMLESSKLHGHYPLTPLQLSFAEEEDYTKRSLEGVELLTETGEKRRAEKIEGRLRSRCCGLVEVQYIHGETFSVVGFLHRSVVEFLEDPTTWNEIVSWVESKKFDATKALLHSSFAEIKAKLPSPPTQASNSDTAAFRAMARLLTFAYSMAGANRKLCCDFYVPKAMELFFLTWTENERGKFSSIPMSPHERFLFNAAQHCTEAQFKPLLDVSNGSTSPAGMEIIPVSKVAAYLLSEYVDERSVPARAAIAKGIITCHANPNDQVSINLAYKSWNGRYKLAVNKIGFSFGWSIWEFFLHYVNDLMTADISRWLETGLLGTSFDIIQSMLDDGADRLSVISVDENKRNKRRGRSNVVQHKASELVKSFCCSVWELRAKRASATHDDLTNFVVKLSRIETAFADEEGEFSGDLHAKARSITSTTWKKPPWTDYSAQKMVSNNAEQKGGDAASNAQRQSVRVQEVQKEQRWRTTIPSQRMNLLCEADRDLAEQLCREDLSLRKQRELFAEIMKRDSALQERIMSCIEAEKAARRRCE